MLTLTVEPSLGSGIEETCAAAQSLANRLQIDIVFLFNDTKCFARIGGDVKKLIREYKTAKSVELPSGQIFRVISS